MDKRGITGSDEYRNVAWAKSSWNPIQSEQVQREAMVNIQVRDCQSHFTVELSVSGSPCHMTSKPRTGAAEEPEKCSGQAEFLNVTLSIPCKRPDGVGTDLGTIQKWERPPDSYGIRMRTRAGFGMNRGNGQTGKGRMGIPSVLHRSKRRTSGWRNSADMRRAGGLVPWMGPAGA